MTPDEQILLLLAAGPAGTEQLAASMGWHDRSVRRRLRRLIRDGYVFSPARGLYRLTARGHEAMVDGARGAESEEAADGDEDWPRHPFERWIGSGTRR